MQRLPLKLASAGMVLAKEVSRDGKVLCGPGIGLTAEIIDRLARVGVTSVTVEGHPVKLPGEKSLRERLGDLEARFSRVHDDPVLLALMKIIAQHWIDAERGQAPAEKPSKAP